MNYEEQKKWVLDYIVGEPNERHTERDLETLFKRDYPDEQIKISKILYELFAENKIELIIRNDCSTLYKAA